MSAYEPLGPSEEAGTPKQRASFPNRPSLSSTMRDSDPNIANGTFSRLGQRRDHSQPTRRPRTSKHKGTNRLHHSQRRAASWRVSTKARKARDKWKHDQLRTGWENYRATLLPTEDDMRSEIRQYNPRQHSGLGLHYVGAQSGTVDDELEREREFLQQLTATGGVGSFQLQKNNGWVRIIFENWNSLGLFSGSEKIDRLNYMLRRLSVDIIAGCEVQCDWSFLPRDQQFTDILCPEKRVRGIAAHNSRERIFRDQYGGTAIASIGRISDVVSAVGTDPSGLGRWVWIRVGDDNTSSSTVVVSAYYPHKASSSSGGRTVWDQHRRYFQSEGIMDPPTKRFHIDLLTQLKKWRRQGIKVILSIDANQDVYRGPLAQALRAEPLAMECMFHTAMGMEVPNSHFRGTRPITTMFGSPGLTIGDTFCFPHAFGIGDHRVFLLDITAESMYGGKLPVIASPASRSLNCNISRIRKQYCSRLHHLATEHRMEARLNNLVQADALGLQSPSSILRAHNRWDKQYGDFMRSAESDCTKFKNDTLAHSPKVGWMIRKDRALQWLIGWYEGRCKNKGNLGRVCRVYHIEQPFTMGILEAKRLKDNSAADLTSIAKLAESWRRAHLQSRLSEARQNERDEDAAEILRIVRRESARKRQRMINSVIRPPRGGAVVAVRVDDEDGSSQVYDTEDGVLAAVSQRLDERFRLGLRAPASEDNISAALGVLGDTDTASAILHGQFSFPAQWDQATTDILQEAALIRVELDGSTPDVSPITPDVYRQFWTTAKERTSSSYSGRHFGHYKAIVQNETLTTLQVTSMNLAGSRGTPLKRWQHGVTVLLEKVRGNISIDKLRAICLLEADFNWWLKVTFTQRLMRHMHRTNTVPEEQIATSGKTAIDGVVMKQLFYDRANVLHASASLSSTDAANCYDAVNHPICSMALQSFGVPLSHIRTYLECLQQMSFHLRTGFGLSGRAYGGTKVRPYMGLTQGSGASPPVWVAVSNLIIRAYRRAGFGVTFTSAWSGLITILAAILFVDDTDLLHMCLNPDTTEEKFVQVVQRATAYWTMLLQATGGNLKPAKCYWYLMLYTFPQGVAQLRPLSALQHHRILIPQPNADPVEITLRDVNDATKTLGVFTCPSGDAFSQLNHMASKGTAWARRVSESSLAPGLVWHSFNTQVIPSMNYGLIPVMAYPSALDTVYQKIYFKSLPALGINRNIRTEWRTLPVEYQGLGMPMVSLDKLAHSLQFLRRHWGAQSSLGTQLRQSFEFLQLETGINGNVFDLSFQQYGHLATHSWMKVLWSYLDEYGVKIDLGEEIYIPQPRDRDRAFMELVFQQFPRNEWGVINRVRQHKRVFFLSQLLLADGITVLPEMMTSSEGPPSNMNFPRQQPTPADFRLWMQVLTSVTSSTFRFSPGLGAYIRRPFDKEIWGTDTDGQYLIRYDYRSGSPTPDQTSVYTASSDGSRSTRASRVYRPATALPRHLPEVHRIASITRRSASLVTIHSTAVWDRAPVGHTPSSSFESNLREYGPALVWKKLTYEGDGSWITQAVLAGSLIGVHDGSYMSEVDDSVCSAAGFIVCTSSKKRLFFSAAERTSTEVASNYRGELLGGMIITLLIRAATYHIATFQTPVRIYCDNKGVVARGNSPQSSLPEKQPHMDILQVIHRAINETPGPVSYKHVFGHLDDTTSFASLSLPQQLNVLADHHAKEVLLSSLSRGRFITSTFPLERCRLLLQGSKVTGSIKGALYSSWGKAAATRLFHDRHIVHSSDFDKIYWTGLATAMRSYPRMFQVWVTKHVSHFGGTNSQLAKYDQTVDPLCPCCGCEEETTAHIVQCTESGRSRLYHEMVNDTVLWLMDTHMPEEFALALGDYLDYRGHKRMETILGDSPTYRTTARDIDCLGWTNFIEGRLSLSLIALQAGFLHASSSRLSILSWSSQFIQRLHRIIHRQWMYRNLRIHLRKREGMTLSEHERIMEEVDSMIDTDPTTLLPQYRRLLEVDFHELGASSTGTRQVWLAELRTALSGSTHIFHQRKRRSSGIDPPLRSNLAKRIRPAPAS